MYLFAFFREGTTFSDVYMTDDICAIHKRVKECKKANESYKIYSVDTLREIKDFEINFMEVTEEMQDETIPDDVQ